MGGCLYSANRLSIGLGVGGCEGGVGTRVGVV